jgi:hypothetical protein
MAIAATIPTGVLSTWQENLAYRQLVAGHPLRPVVETIEAASLHATVIGCEFVEGPTGKKDGGVVLWLHFNGTEEEFVAAHEIALAALQETFPEAGGYMLVWAAIDRDTGKARGMSAMWISPAGASIALLAEDYVEGITLALQHGEAGHAPMRAYGYPAFDEEWYPRPSRYEWPWEREGEQEPERQA